MTRRMATKWFHNFRLLQPPRVRIVAELLLELFHFIRLPIHDEMLRTMFNIFHYIFMTAPYLLEMGYLGEEKPEHEQITLNSR